MGKRTPPIVLKKPVEKQEEKIKEIEPQIIEKVEKEKEEPVEPQIFEEELELVTPETDEKGKQVTEEKVELEKEITQEPLIRLPSYFNEKDGSDMAFIPAGNFVMGNNLGKENERPAVNVYLSAYYIDIYEITNKQYHFFADEFENSSNSNCDLCPVTDISWTEARSYCEWAGKRLPSEAEWEKAASGAQQLEWPWGNSPDQNKANILGDPDFISDKGFHNNPAPVGSYLQGATIFGALDMAGNVWEWTDSTYLPYNNNFNQDIRYQKQYKVLRGGSWRNILENAQTMVRHPVPQNTALPNIGFRCARDAD